jgi:Tol biopolymer transport system component
MLSDPFEAEVAQLLSAAAPPPAAGWQDRALAALAGVRPRRHPNLLTFIIVAALILLLAAGLFAATRYLLVHGTLLSSGFGGPEWQVSSRWLNGELSWETGPETGMNADTSPVSGEIAYYRNEDDQWPTSSAHIWKANSDGSGAVNLTQRSGLGGLNCGSIRWSPDGSMILFEHCDPVVGKMPCQTGFHVWVMNADGSSAHQVTPEGSPPSRQGSWWPDGSHIIATVGCSDEEGLALTMDIWGRHIRVLPNVGSAPACSPDGSMIVSTRRDRGEMHGSAGQWNRLILTDDDGRDPRVLVEQFVADADAEAFAALHRATHADNAPDFDWLGDVQAWAGPLQPAWAPTGDQIAFLAALPFDPDPEGLYFKKQVEVWVYDLPTKKLIRVTDDEVYQHSVSWR